ncbi:hypothetical protein CBS101457_002829 [Exobasidium rhododendri]|nr:hypothetical protein CBS101457_002829 [Exobasidium rhododendri]
MAITLLTGLLLVFSCELSQAMLSPTSSVEYDPVVAHSTKIPSRTLSSSPGHAQYHRPPRRSVDRFNDLDVHSASLQQALISSPTLGQEASVSTDALAESSSVSAPPRKSSKETKFKQHWYVRLGLSPLERLRLENFVNHFLQGHKAYNKKRVDFIMSMPAEKRRAIVENCRWDTVYEGQAGSSRHSFEKDAENHTDLGPTSHCAPATGSQAGLLDGQPLTQETACSASFQKLLLDDFAVRVLNVAGRITDTNKTKCKHRRCILGQLTTGERETIVSGSKEDKNQLLCRYSALHKSTGHHRWSSRLRYNDNRYLRLAAELVLKESKQYIHDMLSALDTETAEKVTLLALEDRWSEATRELGSAFNSIKELQQIGADWQGWDGRFDDGEDIDSALGRLVEVREHRRNGYYL